MTSQGDRISSRRMPTVLLKGCDQGTIANILSFPEHDRKWKRRNQIEQFENSLRGRGILRIRSKVSGFFLQPLTRLVLECGRVQSDLAGRCLSQKALNTV